MQLTEKTGVTMNVPMLWFRFAAVPATALVCLCAGCVHTAPFRDAHGDVIAESIATMESGDLGGISQSIWFRGQDRRKPALILLHGVRGGRQNSTAS